MDARWMISLLYSVVIIQHATAETTELPGDGKTGGDGGQTTTDGTTTTTTDIDVCSSNPCQYGDCMSNGTGYECRCWPGWTGTSYICDVPDECYWNPCVHYCPEFLYLCSCFPGWTGTNCQDVGDCWPRSCVNGMCTSVDRATVCTCWPGWTGTYCEVLMDTSPSSSYGTTTTTGGTMTTTTDHKTSTFNPCENGDYKPTDGGYECSCWPFWMGPNCDTMDECAFAPCFHSCPTTCPCLPGWTGTDCQGWGFTSQCWPRACVYGDCVNDGRGTKCSCLPCATGTYCEVIIDPLGCGTTTMNDYEGDQTTTEETVTPAAVIDDQLGDETSTTTDGDGGQATTDETITHVADHASACESEPCVHGFCTDLNDGYLCTCRPGWTGTNCDERQDHGRVGHQRVRH